MLILNTMLMLGCDSSLLAGLGEPWMEAFFRVGPLSMMFVVALYLPWCQYLAAQEGVEPQLYADNLKCVSGDPLRLLRAAEFTTGYVRLVGPTWFFFLGFVSFGPCSFLVLCMVLRPLFWLLLACAGCGPRSIELCGLGASRWPSVGAVLILMDGLIWMRS